MSAEQQIAVVANYIMAQIPGEPSRSEGAGDCAIRLLKEYRDALRAIRAQLSEPHLDDPPHVVSAYEIAKAALLHSNIGDD